MGGFDWGFLCGGVFTLAAFKPSYSGIHKIVNALQSIESVGLNAFCPNIHEQIVGQ